MRFLIVILMSKGIFESLFWREIEDILIMPGTIEELAGKVGISAERKKDTTKENGTVIFLQEMEA